MHPRREQVVLVHALMKLGAVLLPLGPRLSAEERAAVIAAEEPAVDLDDAGELTQTEADLPLLGEHDMDDVACRVLTSGSTGTPDPVGLTYGNFLWSAVGSAFNIGVEPEDRWLCCLPLSHISGLGIVMRSVIYGTTAVVHDGFDVDRVAEALERDEITVVSLVTTMLTRLLEAGADLSGPRAILVGGGPVPEEPLEEAIGRGATVVQTYGLTEACSQVTTLAPADARAQARLRRAAAADHPPAHPGRRDPRPGADRRARPRRRRRLAAHRRPRPHRRGRLPLRRGPDGRHDRQRRRERRPGRSREGAAAPPRGRRRRGRRPRGPRVAAGGDRDRRARGRLRGEPDELRRHCAESLAGFKVPKRVELAAALPRTPSGKLMRRALR